MGCLQSRHFILLCLTLAIVIRVLWIYLVKPHPVSDFLWYYDRGIDLTAGNGYAMAPNSYWPENIPAAALLEANEDAGKVRPTAYWPVGYPAFLGLLFSTFGPSLFVAKTANVILYGGVLLLSYLLAKRLFGNELTGRITLLVLAFYPNHIAYTSLLASEILFLFLLLSGILLLIVSRDRLGWAIVAGVIFGISGLVKPQIILVPVVFLISTLISELSWKSVFNNLRLIVIVYVFLGIVVSPWLLRNYRTFNEVVFISNNGGINLLVGNNPYATGEYCCHKQISSMLVHVKDERSRDLKAGIMALDHIASHPWQTIKQWPQKLWYLYGTDREGFSWNEKGLKLTPSRQNAFLFLKVLAQLYYMVVLAFFFLALLVLFNPFKNKNREQSPPILGLAVVLYFTGIYLLTFGYSRFHFPMMPWLVMYGAALIVSLLKTSR